MTRAKAAQICQSIKFILENSDYTEAVEKALNMAIEALEQQGTLQNLTKPNKSDLIVKDAGEIKDGLYNIKDGKLFQYKANGGTVRTYQIVSADRPKWIPCSERLPENGEKVLCQTITKKGQINMVIGFYDFERWCCGMNSNVIAWMPLPEAYREDGEEE